MASFGESSQQSSSDPTAGVQVLVRCRPVLSHEQHDDHMAVEMTSCGAPSSLAGAATTGATGATVSVTQANMKHTTFTVDGVFDSHSTQDDIYSFARPLVDQFLQGTNACIMTYGAGATGKTFTLFGTPDEPGILPRAVHTIFASVPCVCVSHLEIYSETLSDLLWATTNIGGGVPPKMRIMHDQQVIVSDCTMVEVHSADECMALFHASYAQKHQVDGMMNSATGRSHTIFTMHLHNAATGRMNKLLFVDTPGSERRKSIGITGKSLKEGASIGKSFCALSNVISALTSTVRKNVPYRDSYLTRLLQDSLNGSAKLLLVVTCSPTEAGADETVSSLKFATTFRRLPSKLPTMLTVSGGSVVTNGEIVK